jgi:hypothetical protein
VEAHWHTDRARGKIPALSDIYQVPPWTCTCMALTASYFASAHPAALVVPNGERLPADIVALSASQHAEAQPANTVNDATHHAGPYPIGHVDQIVGDVTVEHNGVTVMLHAGDAIYKNDVIHTGSTSSVSISLSAGRNGLFARRRIGRPQRHGRLCLECAARSFFELSH